MRTTKQRSVILDQLRRVNTHPTADELYGMVRPVLPRISLGTVYRNLEILSRSGAVIKLELGGGQKRFDGCVEPHYHLHCLACGRVTDVTMKPLRDLEDRITDKRGFLITGHTLEFTGICPECATDSKKNSSLT